MMLMMLTVSCGTAMIVQSLWITWHVDDSGEVLLTRIQDSPASSPTSHDIVTHVRHDADICDFLEDRLIASCDWSGSDCPSLSERCLRTVRSVQRYASIFDQCASLRNVCDRFMVPSASPTPDPRYHPGRLDKAFGFSLMGIAAILGVIGCVGLINEYIKESKTPNVKELINLDSEAE
jgi:hypothetical protein